jgi:hypothetical protein
MTVNDLINLLGISLERTQPVFVRVGKQDLPVTNVTVEDGKVIITVGP